VLQMDTVANRMHLKTHRNLLELRPFQACYQKGNSNRELCQNGAKPPAVGITAIKASKEIIKLRLELK